MSQDVYAQFGVHNAVISSSDISEHEQNMLALNVDARDGDDALTLEETEEVAEEGQEEESQDEPDEQEEQEGEQEEAEGDEPDEGLELLPEASGELKEASEALTKYATGFDSLRAQAVKQGLSVEAAGLIETEYETDNKLSEASYAALEKVGYDRNFVDSYIQAQEALAERFVNGVVAYAGGTEKYNRIIAHMEATNPESVESLNEAMERQDLKAIRSIINLGIQSHGKKFGKAPARSVTKSAPAAPARAKAPAVTGYASRSEMIADMGKSEYRLDPAFRAKVEARVAASSF